VGKGSRDQRDELVEELVVIRGGCIVGECGMVRGGIDGGGWFVVRGFWFMDLVRKTERVAPHGWLKTGKNKHYENLIKMCQSRS
jgi:hypothetical protein